ncbi:unnamed protein product [Didymodactylos carnosus]|uniref:Uncharacterized protein n=1 Tax=Didymodactylos carnosus TaxID=1234261 RepID=A0A814CU75_9BILA|nr:unnamed protein product [Didymodactylos carnosus]CAF0945068.1 unnamed protein product [Didymodactylos carnosus]CAF3637839.1 unnamed protein product [Didymodactylos carnosus]CAF3721299.1 unnamed protein product [Didymodactylos carnosus]
MSRYLWIFSIYLLLSNVWSLTSGLNKKIILNKNSINSNRKVFINKNDMDLTISPAKNYFLYANGLWLNKTQIPPSETSWGEFTILDNNIRKKLKLIMDDLTLHNKTYVNGSLQQKVADLYISGIHMGKINKLGYTPIKYILDQLKIIKNYTELINFLSDMYKNYNMGYLFDFYVGADDKNSSVNMINFQQTGIDLPERDYYFRNDPTSKIIREKYLLYIQKILKLTNSSKNLTELTRMADDILSLETQLAASHRTPNELRDPIKNYNSFQIDDLQKLMPNIDWPTFLKHIMVNMTTILMGQPDYYQLLDRLITTQPLDIWKNKIKFSIVNSFASYLSKEFADAKFDFYQRLIKGQKQQQERWKTVITTIDKSIGDLLGQLFVQKYFPLSAKQRMLEMVNNLQQVYHKRIEKLDWMSTETKEKALEKLTAITKKIGYPEKWKTYDSVIIDSQNFFLNIKSVLKYAFNEMIDKVGKPVDRTEWDMTTPTVNAYYNPLNNEIVFPAGILQFPFFDLNADDAINYGGIGTVIGHEMTHGFDDSGRQYDKDGNLKQWWTKEDENKFKEKLKVIIDQYNKFKVLDDQYVNGQLTLGENIADNGGVVIAYNAFKLTKQGQENNVTIDNFTPDQRFFLSYAQIWRGKMTDALLLSLLKKDPHAPANCRVNGPLSNLPAFYQTFNVTSHDDMYRPSEIRVNIW